jgi:hypothetical protein
MKTYILSIIFILSVTGSVFAGNDKETGASAPKSAIAGKVIDQSTSEELAGVIIQIEGTDVKAYSDIEGNFRIEGVEPGNYNLTVSYISYQEKLVKNIQASIGSAGDVQIKLEQKN